MTEQTYDHELEDIDTNVHRDWDSSRNPVLIVESGDTVRFSCRHSFHGEITRETTADDLRTEPTPGHPLTGPVAVRGLDPGDVLAIEFTRIDHGEWGYTLFRPGSWGVGLLPGSFPDPEIHIWELGDESAPYVEGVEIPLDPFPGVAGVPQRGGDSQSTVPPRRVGGNLDIKHLVEGSTLYLPVEVAGGLFSIGDGHAAQGDGEVCVSGIEAPLTVTVRLTARPDMDIAGPRFEAPADAFGGPTDPVFATAGVETDLMTAARTAITEMIDYLTTERGLTRDQAYILCSVVVDLKINELVNDPNYVVSTYLPTGIFSD